jgi:hypothetical protein
MSDCKLRISNELCNRRLGHFANRSTLFAGFLCEVLGWVKRPERAIVAARTVRNARWASATKESTEV